MVHFHAVAIKFIFLEGNGFAQSLALIFSFLPHVAAGIHVMLDFGVVHAAIHAECFKDWTKFGDGLVGACNDLFGDWNPLFGKCFEQVGAGLAFEHQCQFPCQIERILDRRV